MGVSVTADREQIGEAHLCEQCQTLEGKASCPFSRPDYPNLRRSLDLIKALIGNYEGCPIL